MPVALAPKITSGTFFYEPPSDYYNSTMSGDDDENWATIEDKKVRRRIQNRHSQRKRRTKLREQRQSMQSTSSSSSGPESYPTSDSSVQRPSISCLQRLSRDSSISTDLTSTTIELSPVQQATHNRSMSDFSGIPSSLEQNYLTNEDAHMRTRHSRSMPGSFTLPSPQFMVDSTNYHDPLSTYELDRVDWAALDLLDDKVTTSVLPDGRLMDFNCLENQNEIFNAQIQMAMGLGSLIENPDMDHLHSPNSSANYFTLPKAAGCFSATPQLSELHPVSTDGEPTSGGAGHGSTALHLAAQHGHLQIAQLLLDTAADVNAINSNGESTLHLAVASKNHAMVSLLLKHGADHNMRNGRQESVLHLAVETGDLGLVRLLLSREVDLELQDALGQTALHRAAAKGFEDVVWLLMCKGADSTANVGSAH